MLITSADGGKNLVAPRGLPDGILGPVKNKPILYQRSTAVPVEHRARGLAGLTSNGRPTGGKTWSQDRPACRLEEVPHHSADHAHAPGGKLQILCRSRQRKIVESWSTDGGLTWSPLAATVLPNPDSGIDAVNLQDGRILLVYNHTPRGRSPMNVAISADGKTWQAALDLETERGEFSYPGRDLHARRQRAHHLHLEAQKDQARRA